MEPEERHLNFANETPLSKPDLVQPAASASYAFSSWAFQRCTGLCYLFAFGSLTTQIVGLVGGNGILPLAALGELAKRNQTGFQALGVFSFIGTADQSLQFLCWVGVIASLLLCAGVLTPVMFLVCWLSWLSLVYVGQDFLSFQWDILLLEAGFLSIFLAPWRLFDWPLQNKEWSFAAPPVISVWLFRWLLFRLMLESGMCKITSGDTTWQALTAMNYHYHTQPLPTPVSWLADKLPEIILKFQTFLTLAIELVSPFLIPFKRLRLLGAGCLMLLQVCIALSGNYAFFNLLTFSLCFFLIADDQWIKLLTSARKNVQFTTFAQRKSLAQFAVVALSSALVILLSTGGILAQLIQLPEVIQKPLQFFSPYYIANTYGLFATMTTVRNEIILEGSDDGVTWKLYEFKCKPGDIRTAPCIVAPFQPRLDWQMWFASLANIRSSQWFLHFIVKIFENSPEVLGLLKTNPFPGKSPNFLRANLYTYSFSDPEELMHSGNWWRSEFRGVFLPAVSSFARSRNSPPPPKINDRLNVSSGAKQSAKN